MAEPILMPRLSDTMTEGVIAAWHKNVGDTVKKGDLLAEIETDKATMELESYQEGILLHRGAPDGQKLQVNDLLAIIGKQGEDVSALVTQHSGGNGQAAAEAKPETQEASPVAPEAPTPAPQAPTANAQPIDLANMEEVVLMPRLSDTMTEGVIAAWQKNIGDTVKKGEVLAEIETDKATMELESYKNGTLLYQGAKPGEKIQVNDLLCIIGDAGMNIDAIVAASKGGIVTQAPAATTAPVAQQEPAAALQGASAPQQLAVVNEGRIIASPLAKKLAEEKGVDLRYVKGSGDNGRIVKQDIDGFTPAQAQGASQVQAPSQPATSQQPAAQQQPAVEPTAKAQEAKPQTPATASGIGQVSFDEVPVSQMRKTIARRLAESKFSAPHFYLTMSIDMDQAVQTRAKLNELSPVKISFNDLVLKAAAVALKQHPKINSSWLGDKIRINHHVNIGVAVAVDEGLLVPVVRFADAKGLSQISTEVKQFAQKAKDKKLQPSDWEGSTFTISNLGMFGIDEFTAIINPPDACILAIGGISQVPVVKNGQVVPGNVMKVTLSCDHRVVDGASGAAFLQTLKSLLEEPLRMLV
ncbi:pyruvate dehydrogenase complex dihydrolipoamide acetyltransferase [Segetibacter aerophilus]|uniref:Acetyltransferase component of pyruvate dehydrogenase complex n=1 Tax=Segetibacter aerophilus TaxID=670293 RepID=A0A512BG47_9BACT|nr:pyruvate dehydrogenase complex dihydrolipoamide acetyltransferase [Segetibacter aerophilus]GEO10933.1 dihydrolipoamide acetyltransferase component of pyruvate dehydrogenase complex [Segetibacter aerophilus]